MFERDRTEEYREYMIHRILEIQKQDHYTREELLKKATSQIEDIFANVKQKGNVMEKKETARERYDKANTIKVTIKLNRKTDQDIIAYLEASGNKQGTIKEALREKMARG